jgi:hypothetical protein
MVLPFLDNKANDSIYKNQRTRIPQFIPLSIIMFRNTEVRHRNKSARNINARHKKKIDKGLRV